MRKIIVATCVLLFFLCSCNKDKTPKSEESLQGNLSCLEPQPLFNYFEEICKIPRESGDIKAISDYLVNFAQKNNLQYHRDEHNNVIIYAAASKGYENAAPIALQGHMDMVCESVSLFINPRFVGVKPFTDGKYVWADCTSLGADNGIGMSIILDILTNPNSEHPPLEAIFTIDEEIGLVGANTLDMSLLQSQRMINIDSEQEAVCFVSSASGLRFVNRIPVEFEEITNYAAFKIEISNLLGGHSGLTIHLGRQNANVLMAKLLQPTLAEYDVRIKSWKGGTVHNVIAHNGSMVVAVPQSQAKQFISQINTIATSLKTEFAKQEPDMLIEITQDVVSKVTTSQTSQDIVNVLCQIPDGLIEMSTVIPDLASISLNTGVSELTDSVFLIETFMRSNKNEAIQPLFTQFTNVVNQYGGTYTILAEYAAWDYAENSPLRTQFLQSYKSVLGKEAVYTAMHAGLECGIFVSRKPQLDAISIGPNIYDAHSIDEKVEVQSVANMYAVILDILKNCK